MTTKKCRDCSAEAEPHRVRCRPCLDRISAAVRAKYRENPKPVKERVKRWQVENYRTTRDLRLRRNYGISIEEYEDMVRRQGALCAICNQPETSRSSGNEVKMLSVDHCHETGRVRGLLCNNCNRAIGLFNDDPELLMKAARYLTERHDGLAF